MSIREVDTKQELDELLTSDDDALFIVKFGATWCRPCEDAQPSFKILAEEMNTDGRNVQCVVLNKTEDNEEVFELNEISKLPTFVLFKKGSVKAKISRPDHAHLFDHFKSHLPNPALFLDADF